MAVSQRDEQQLLNLFSSSLQYLTWNNAGSGIEVLTNIAKSLGTKYVCNLIYMIETHMLKMTADTLLLAIHLIDYFIKNIGNDYICALNQRIPWICSDVILKLDEQSRPKLYDIRRSWTNYFPVETLQQLDWRVNQVDNYWPFNTPMLRSHEPQANASNQQFSGRNNLPTNNSNLIQNRSNRTETDRPQPQRRERQSQQHHPNNFNNQSRGGFRNRGNQHGGNNRFDPLRSNNRTDFKRGSFSNNNNGHSGGSSWRQFGNNRDQRQQRNGNNGFRGSNRFVSNRNNTDNNGRNWNRRGQQHFQSSDIPPSQNRFVNIQEPVTPAVETQELYQKLVEAIVPSNLVEKEYNILSSDDKSYSEDVELNDHGENFEVNLDGENKVGEQDWQAGEKNEMVSSSTLSSPHDDDVQALEFNVV